MTSTHLSRDTSTASLLTSLEDALHINPGKEDSSGEKAAGDVGENDMTLMRKMVMMGVADGEKLYLEILQVMINVSNILHSVLHHNPVLHLGGSHGTVLHFLGLAPGPCP